MTFIRRFRCCTPPQEFTPAYHVRFLENEKWPKNSMIYRQESGCVDSHRICGTSEESKDIILLGFGRRRYLTTILTGKVARYTPSTSLVVECTKQIITRSYCQICKSGEAPWIVAVQRQLVGGAVVTKEVLRSEDIQLVVCTSFTITHLESCMQMQL